MDEERNQRADQIVTRGIVGDSCETFELFRDAFPEIILKWEV
jgi:hypothetical protein